MVRRWHDAPRRQGWKRLTALLTVVVVAFAFQTSPANSAEPREAGCEPVPSLSGNMVYDAESSCDGDYTPDIASADDESKQLALGIYMGALKFCINFPTLKEAQAFGYDSGGPPDGTHHFFPTEQAPAIRDVKQLTEGPLRSTAMVNADNTIGGYMVYNYEGLPYLGKIPRTHRHTKDNNPNDEMFHTYCKTTIEEAFAYKEENSQNPPSVTEMKEALQRAEQGGLAAVSSQLSGSTVGNVMPPAGAATLGGAYVPVGAARKAAAGDVAGSTQSSRAISNPPWSKKVTSGTTTPAASSSTSARQRLNNRLDSMSDSEIETLLRQLG